MYANPLDRRVQKSSGMQTSTIGPQRPNSRRKSSGLNTVNTSMTGLTITGHSTYIINQQQQLGEQPMRAKGTVHHKTGRLIAKHRQIYCHHYSAMTHRSTQHLCCWIYFGGYLFYVFCVAIIRSRFGVNWLLQICKLFC